MTRQHTFTLVELMAVIAIIAILAGIVLGGLSFASRKSMEAQTIAKMEQFQIALEKFQTGAAGVSRREAIWAEWDRIREKVGRQLGDQESFVRSLRSAGCPTAPEEIGLDKAQFIHGIFAAQLIRKRYTVLDLLYDAGLLNAAVEKMF